MLNFQGTVYIRNGITYSLPLIGGSIFLVNPGSVLIINQQGYSIKKAIRMIFICLLIMICVVLLGLGMSVVGSSHNILWMEYLSTAMVSSFPLSRIFDTIIGINLGYIFINYEGKIVKRYCTYGEIYGVVLAVIANICMDVFVEHPSYNVTDKA